MIDRISTQLFLAQESAVARLELGQLDEFKTIYQLLVSLNASDSWPLWLRCCQDDLLLGPEQSCPRIALCQF